MAQFRYFRFLVLLLAVSFLSLQGYAKPIDAATAKTIGSHFLTYQTTGKAYKNGTSLQLVYTSASTATGAHTAYFYVFNTPSGFVIVSADDQVSPILGYSDEKPFPATDIPYVVSKWLESYKAQIRNVITNNIAATPAIKDKWAQLENPTPQDAPMGANTVNPLCKTSWNQLPYYNSMCPYDAAKGKHAVTGCVATAMAQLMKFWNYPATGSGFYSYNDNTYGTQSASFGGTTYDWSSMPNSINSSNTAIATLMYHCGVSVNMAYGVDESSAYVISSQSPVTNCAEYALKTYFGYKSTLKGIARSSYTDATWLAAIKGELDAGRPVIYAGFGTGGGHCFVCDGYDNNSYLHMNWGWGSYYDGYFASDALNPGGVGTGGGSGGYNDGQQAIIGIEPPQSSATYTMSLADNVTLSSTSIYYGQPFTVSTNIANFSTTDFSGDYCAAIFDNNNTFIDYVEVKTGQSLQAGYKYTSDLTFSYAGSYALLPGTYTIGVYYRATGGDWSIVADNKGYINYGQIKVLLANTIEMYQPFSITPTTLIQGKAASVSLDVANYGTTSFSGTLDVSLYNIDGTNAFTIQQMPNMTLNANSYYQNNLTFSTTDLNVAPGTYLMAILFKPANGSWQLTGSTYYQNPIKVTVKAPPILPDKYEANNTIDSAYTFNPDFQNDAATITTTGANCHTGSDLDYYKITLSPGYDYTFNAHLDDSRYNPDGLTYTLDAVVSYSTDKGANWSETYDDIMPSDNEVKGATAIYFKVAPYFSGQTGTYNLEVALSRTRNSGISPAMATGQNINMYPNPVKGTLHMDLSGIKDHINRIAVLDMQGRELLANTDVQANATARIDLGDLSSGLYMVKIETVNGVISRKITVSR